MTPTVLAAAVSAGVASSLLLPLRPRLRVRRRAPDSSGAERAALLRLRPVLVALAFAAAWAFVGGIGGSVAGLVAAAFAWRVLGRAESPSVRRRREELDRDLPVAVHLLGACLESGAAMSAALDAVTAALPGAVADELGGIGHRLALGVDPVAVWSDVAAQPQLRPLGRAMARAHQSGASVRETVERLSDELSAQSRARVEALARSVEVRAAAPLGACFLPAFLLLGVVPMVAGVFSAMRLFG